MKKHDPELLTSANIFDGEPQSGILHAIEDEPQTEVYQTNDNALYKVPGSHSPPGELDKGIDDLPCDNVILFDNT
jgi:hypothetical protein